ncbi:growth arrest-specific protein 1-like [Plodia interpunctella]|uniref:growth arrest-specific protein 1-like n=1 Tax=Plodia interpunctella TaxID=58824 RepID=UPI0023686ED5|nr:growth arrest-specific protein 1-like [Plodia interpunctella]XP_053614609.1 growth arrest-specific protein 1-like [Plodia interpunctella]
MWLAAAVVASVAAVARATLCDEARLRCAYRSGCGTALNNYMLYCNDVLSRPMNWCPEECEHALIALTSTEEGKDLMNCQCNNEYCRETKQRIEVCRTQVLKGAANVTSSCRLSQLICLADSQCSTALDFYHRLCWSMYEGRKCSRRCRNSITILRKQEKAAALTSCKCDGNEEYDCPKMQSNFARLCFKHNLYKGKKKVKEEHVPEVVTAAASLIPLSQLLLVVSYWTCTQL